MPQVMPRLTYPGGCSAFFADLHLNFPRWLRLVSLVPLVHASIEGISYDELCIHLLHIFPSNPSNVLVVSAERIRSSVAEMLSSEPFFVCSLADNGSTSSTSRWVYESTFDSDPSRISFAFCILRSINLFPGWSVRDNLSGLISVTLPQSTYTFVLDESRGRQERQSVYNDSRYSPPQSVPIATVLFPNSSLIGPSAPPARTGLDSPYQQKSQLSVLGSIMTYDPRPCETLYPHGSVLIPMGLTASQENPHPDTGHELSHLSPFHQTPKRFGDTTEQSSTIPHASEDTATDSTAGPQYELLTSEFLTCPAQRPSQLFAGRFNSFGNAYAKSPLFLPSQTPIRSPVQDISSPSPGSTPEGSSTSQGSRMCYTGDPHTDRPHSDSMHTSVIQRVGVFEVDGVIRLHDDRTLLTSTVTSRPPSPLQWPGEPATNGCPQVLSAESNNWPPCAGLPEIAGKKGSVTHEAIPAVFSQAQGDIVTNETSALKRTRRPVTPVHHATTLDAPFSTPTPRARRSLTPSPLTLRNSGDHEELTHSDQGQTHPLNPSENTSQILRQDRSGCTLLTPLSSTPQSSPRRHSSVIGPSRPSVIVYKVATGPNIAGSKDVIRVSYGEGYRRRIHTASLGHRNKERKQGRQGYLSKEYGNARRHDTTKYLNRKATRSKLRSARANCDEKCPASTGLLRADTKVSGKLPLVERMEGDMAWDFGAGPEKCRRRVDMDRTRVRVGGLTSVRMIPRTAVDGESGSKIP